MFIVYTTCASGKEAEKIAQEIIRNKLAVCANWWPIRSLYHWQGKIARGKEVALIFKTSENKFSQIERAIKKMHSYDTPCILEWEINKSSGDYTRWARSVLS